MILKAGLFNVMGAKKRGENKESVSYEDFAFRPINFWKKMTIEEMKEIAMQTSYCEYCGKEIPAYEIHYHPENTEENKNGF